MGVALPSLDKALVSAEAFPKSLCDALARPRHRRLSGLRDRPTSARSPTRREAREGLVVDEGVLVEIVRPGTGDPVAPGEVGEVVVTSLFNTDYPLIRFGTGDLSAVLPGRSPCGRTNVRIKGWMGRADQTTKVKGMFVHPAQVAAIVAPPPGDRARRGSWSTTPTGTDRMTLQVEVPDNRSSSAEAIVASIRDVTKLRGEVAFRAPGELPNDGKVIDDVRKYD